MEKNLPERPVSRRPHRRVQMIVQNLGVAGPEAVGCELCVMTTFPFLLSACSGSRDPIPEAPPSSNFAEETVSVSTKSFLCGRVGDELVCTNPLRAECLIFQTERGVPNVGQCMPLDITTRVKSMLCAIAKTLQCD